MIPPVSRDQNPHPLIQLYRTVRDTTPVTLPYIQSTDEEYIVYTVHICHTSFLPPRDCLFFGHLSCFFSILNNRWNSKRWRHSRHVKKKYTNTHPHHHKIDVQYWKDRISTASVPKNVLFISVLLFSLSLSSPILLEFRFRLFTIIIFLNSENHGVG